MNRNGFQYICQHIQDDPIFQNQSHCKQAPVHTQLQSALYKLRHNGNATNYVQCASNWDVFKSHIYKTTVRVVKTLCNLKDEVIKWPEVNNK